MNPNTIRRVSDRDGARGPRFLLMRWSAIFLATLTVCATIWLLGRDIGWESRLREAQAAADSAIKNGNFRSAKEHYLLALANQPYDWESHLALARLEMLRFNDYESALRHFLYALAYSPEQSTAQEVKGDIEVLRMIRRGELENPRDALEDMFLAVEEGARLVFLSRLAPNLESVSDAYWQAWSQRGRGFLNYCQIRGGNDGIFDANIELFFPDNTSMSMRFYCVKGSAWQLELSFP